MLLTHDADTVAVTVMVGVSDTVTEMDDVSDTVGEIVGVSDIVGDTVGVMDCVPELERDVVPVEDWV